MKTYCVISYNRGEILLKWRRFGSVDFYSGIWGKLDCFVSVAFAICALGGDDRFCDYFYYIIFFFFSDFACVVNS